MPQSLHSNVLSPSHVQPVVQEQQELVSEGLLVYRALAKVGPRAAQPRVQLALFEERGSADEALPALAARTAPLPAVDARVLATGEPVADLGRQAKHLVGNLALL